MGKGIRGKKLILKEKLGSLKVFQKIASKLSDNVHGVPKEEFMEFLKTISPDHDPETTFKWVMEWGRHGLLLKYDARRHMIKTWVKVGRAKTQTVAE